MTGVAAAALITDLDGTLVDSQAHYLATVRAVFASYGVRRVERDVYNRCTGLSTRDMLVLLRRHYHVPAPADALMDDIVRVYRAGLPERVPLFPAAAALLLRAHAGGLPTAVASGSPARIVAAVLEGHGLSHAVDARAAAEDVRAGKPAPDLFLHAAHSLGIAPERCLVLEDSVPGVEAAARAGMRCVAVPDPATAHAPFSFASADLVLPRDDLARVWELLDCSTDTPTHVRKQHTPRLPGAVPTGG
ncbi:HAD family phosphatase [Streptomyces rimosus]|uniref:HAD family hydrolase n=1 Tax=Streptomyces rimosus TaxID=1927 RepID=UPI00067ACFA2|nr:HAD family phosphatase [Streptomyces rimosus]